MNKKTKGLITAALGASLVFGSASTFALWQDTEAVGQGTIYTGDLDLTAQSFTWTWEKVSNTKNGYASGQTFTPASQKIVPGDQVKAVSTAAYTLIGNTIVAELTLGGVPLTAAQYYDLNVSVYVGSTKLSPVTDSTSPNYNKFVIASDLVAGGSAPTFTIYVGLPTKSPAQGPGTAVNGFYHGYSRNRQVSLADLQLTLTQVTNGTPYTGQ